VVILYVLLLLFPRTSIKPLATGIDMSWKYALHTLPDTEFTFGRDVAFTLGPLGYVTDGILVGAVGRRGAVLRVFLHLSLGVALFLYLARTGNRPAFWPFAICFLIACASLGRYYDLCYDYRLLFLMGLFISVALRDGPARLWALYPAAFFAAFALFVKLNTGIGAGGMLALAGAVLLVRQRSDWKHVLGSGIFYLLMALALAQLLLGSIRYIPTWLRASYELVNGYSSAMSLARSPSALLRGLAIWTVYLSFAVWCGWRRRPLGLVAVLLSVPMFIAFKGGFVRHGGLFFFLIAPMMTTLLILDAEEPRETAAGLACFGLTLALVIPSRIEHWRNVTSWPREVVQIATLRRGIERMGSFLSLSTTQAEMSSRSRALLQADRLPQEWLTDIDAQQGSVAVVPWEITYCPANDLRWDPTPTLQLYASYTAWLDDWNAAHFDGPRRPDWIIADYAAIDGRHLLWDTPATWRALLGNYRVARIDVAARRLLLRKNAQPAAPALETVGHGEAMAHQWIEVPDSDAPLYVAAETPRRPFGMMLQTFFRFPPVMVEILYEGGQAGGARVPPDVMSNGLLINRLPRDAHELAELFESRLAVRVRRFRITGPGADFLAGPIPLTWKRAIRGKS
jgi:hypothetical protein